VFCCFFILLAGCASSELVDTWSDSSYQAPPLNKMLVISVGKNPAVRRIWEDAFGVELTKHNVAATPSYRLFPDAVPDTDQVIQSVRSNGFDGILITCLLPSETTPQYVQGKVTGQQEMRYDRRRGRFVLYYRDIAQAGYVDSQKVDIRSIDVWTTQDDGRLIWSTTSKSPEPNSAQIVRPEIVKLVMSELTQQRIIAAQK
jgi:hypothetical protein